MTAGRLVVKAHERWAESDWARVWLKAMTVEDNGSGQARLQRRRRQRHEGDV
jgi:hypothetical protein